MQLAKESQQIDTNRKDRTGWIGDKTKIDITDKRKRGQNTFLVAFFSYNCKHLMMIFASISQTFILLFFYDFSF